MDASRGQQAAAHWIAKGTGKVRNPGGGPLQNQLPPATAEWRAVARRRRGRARTGVAKWRRFETIGAS